MENAALWPLALRSMPASAAAASSMTEARSAPSSALHAGQRRRNIWCSTAAPSSVRGTAGRLISGNVFRLLCYFILTNAGHCRSGSAASQQKEFAFPQGRRTRLRGTRFAARRLRVHLLAGVRFDAALRAEVLAIVRIS